MDIIERLDGPHEWGYRGLTGEGFIHDPAPNDAAREIAFLRREIERLQLRLTPTAEIWGKFKEQIDDRDKATIVATIERCAQVVENFYHEGTIPFGLKSDIAAAIRGLRDEP